jgi:hypothetical protein
MVFSPPIAVTAGPAVCFSRPAPARRARAFFDDAENLFQVSSNIA